MRDCSPFKTTQKQFIKCHFYVGWGPFWAWVCSILDRQDSINELLNCVLTQCDRIALKENTIKSCLFSAFLFPKAEI